jgi:hypothetical protein
MKRFEASTIAGLLLIGAGLLFLFANIGLLGAVAGPIWALLFALGGGVFISVSARNRARWWALIPGCTLLGLAALIGADAIVPGGTGPWGGALFLGAISLSFWLVYVLSYQRWWALIPAGTLLTLAAIAGLSGSWPGRDMGWLLFAGLALTFGLVYLDPFAPHRRAWALYPAAGLLVMALIVAAPLGATFNLVWPAALILAGLYLALRPPHPVPAPPAPPAAPADRLGHIERLVNDATQQPVPSDSVGEPAPEPQIETEPTVPTVKEDV